MYHFTLGLTLGLVQTLLLLHLPVNPRRLTALVKPIARKLTQVNRESHSSALLRLILPWPVETFSGSEQGNKRWIKLSRLFSTKFVTQP